MSLATRCTACGTVFRVAQDQLKASEGWVRCGRCSEVFNALEGLFDLEGSSGPMPLAREIGTATPAAPPMATSEPRPAPTSSPVPLAGDDLTSEPASSTLIDTQADTRAPSGFQSSFSAVTEHAEPGVDLRVDSQVPDDALVAEISQEEAPAFLRRAERDARWQQPRVRRSLWILGALMLALLLAQWSLHQRNALAARWPASLPLLSALCAVADCSVGPPRQLAALAVDSSGLTRLEGAALYRLQLAVRNRGEVPVAMPWLDLTLTDLRGDVVARRVLRASELMPGAPDRIAAGGDWSMAAVLDLGEHRVAGYTVELFYP